MVVYPMSLLGMMMLLVVMGCRMCMSGMSRMVVPVVLMGVLLVCGMVVVVMGMSAASGCQT